MPDAAPTPPQLVAALAELPVLAGLQPTASELGSLELATFAPGETLLEAGATGTRAGFVLRGSAVARKGKKLLSHLGPGQCFGERALLEDTPRTASVVADTELAVLWVGADTFRAWATLHPPLASHIATLHQVYQRPDGSVVSIQADTLDGAPCMRSERRLRDGRTLRITSTTAQDRLLLEVDGQPAHDEVLEHDRAAPGSGRRLFLVEGRVVRADIRGEASGVGPLTARMVAGRALADAERARFQWTGQTGPLRGAPEMLCSCVGLTRPEAEALVGEGVAPDQLSAHCGASTICGRCRDDVAQLGQPPPAPKKGLLRRLFGL